MQRAHLLLHVIEALAWLVSCVVLFIVKLLVEKHSRVGHILEATVHDTCPIVPNKLNRVVIEKDPFLLWCFLFLINLACLILYIREFDALQIADLDENTPEKGEIVIVSEADHTT